MAFERLAVIGVGLIGGSFALAAKGRGLVGSVVGVARSQETLSAALECGVADEVTTSIQDAAAHADLVYIATPVGSVGSVLEAIAPVVKAETVVTDAASTKSSIMSLAARHLKDRCIFIGGHPIAGSEQAGPRHARADLFAGKTYVLTTFPDTPAAELSRMREVVGDIGARVVVCDGDQHDQLLAATSHLPHLLASALCSTLSRLAPRTGDLALFSGTGLADTTRVAAGPSDVWRDILVDNAANIVPVLEAFEETVAAYRRAMETEAADALERLLSEASQFRRDIDKQ